MVAEGAAALIAPSAGMLAAQESTSEYVKARVENLCEGDSEEEYK